MDIDNIKDLIDKIEELRVILASMHDPRSLKMMDDLIEQYVRIEKRTAERC